MSDSKPMQRLERLNKRVGQLESDNMLLRLKVGALQKTLRDIQQAIDDNLSKPRM